MRLTDIFFDPSRTSFDFDAAHDQETVTSPPLSVPPMRVPKVRKPIPALIPTECLSMEQPAGTLHNWQISPLRVNVEKVTPNHIIGAVIKIPQGRTSPIAAVDPLTRRIRTLSGSVYELGIPDKLFLSTSPEVLACMGF